MKFERLISGLYYSSDNSFRIEHFKSGWQLAERASKGTVSLNYVAIETFHTLKEAKDAAYAIDCDNKSPFGLRACVELINMYRDNFHMSADEIHNDLVESEEKQGVFFNRKMWDAFHKVFPDFIAETENVTETTTESETADEPKEDETMKTTNRQYFKVTFAYSEDVFCSNLAHAESISDVERYYSEYSWFKISECEDWQIAEAQRKGMPIIEIDHIDEEPETTDENESEVETMNMNTMQTVETIETTKETAYAATLSPAQIPMFSLPRFVTPVVFRAMTGILITEKMTGKMEGMQSLSTSCLTNPFCRARMKDPDSICAKCYAKNSLEYRKTQNAAYMTNFEILTTRVLESYELPTITAPAFRFEAFGDVFNLTQMRNYIAIANHNPSVMCALWSKNIAIVERAFAMYGKPSNLTFVYSISNMNASINEAEFKSEHPFVDHVFIVVNADYAIENNIVVNCARKCMNCLKCYTRHSEFVIYEILKQQEKRYFKALENA